MEKILKNRCANEEYKLEKYHLLQILKKEAESKLKTVSLFFPHFSSHDISHSMKIISSIELLLTQEQLETLTTSDIVLFLMACYYHDIGMSISFEFIKELFESEKWKDELIKYSKSDLEDIAIIAGRLCLYPDNKYEYKILDIYKDLVIIIETEFRKKHGQRSAEYIINNNELIKNLLGLKLTNILAEICKFHEKNVKEINKLTPEENGLFQDYVHPRLIAYLLCLGDLLDMDTDRFDKYILEATTPMSHISVIHKKKHESVKRLLFKDGLIYISSDCSDQETYRCMREWVDWIKKICDFGIIYWRDLIPDNFGNAPVLRKCEILLNGQKKWAKYALKKQTISTEKALELLSGAGIYNNKFLFVREIIQNAVDATLIRIYKEYENYYKDIDFLEWIKNNNELLIDKYCIEGKITLEDNNIVFTLRDSGIGITDDDIKNILLFKGKSEELKNIINRLPEWFRPSGAFSLGLQSVFQVTKSFSITTKTLCESAKEIILEKVKGDKGYITVKDCDSDLVCGSIVKIIIDNSSLNKNDLNCSDFDYNLKPLKELIYNKLIDELKIDNNPFLVSYFGKKKYYDYIPIKIIDIFNEKKKAEKIKVSMFNLDFFQSDKMYKIDKDDEIIGYKGFDKNNSCIVSLKLFEKDHYYDSCSIYYRNVFVCDIKGYDYFISENKINNYISYSINLLSGNSDKILSLGRNSIRDTYKETLSKTITECIDLALKRIIENLLDDVNSGWIPEEKHLFLIILQEAKRLNHRFDELQKKIEKEFFGKNICDYSKFKLNNESNSEIQDSFELTYKQLNETLFFIEEIITDEEDLNNKLDDLNIPSIPTEDRIYLSTIFKDYVSLIISHYVISEYIYKDNNKLYLVLGTKLLYSDNKIVKRSEFILLIEFLCIVFDLQKNMKPDENYKELLVSYNEIRNKYFLPVSIDDDIKKDLQSQLTQNGFISDKNKYLKRIYDSNSFKANLDYVISYNHYKKTSIDKLVIENKYKELWLNRMKMLENQSNANLIKERLFEKIYTILFSKESNNSESCYFVW